MPFDSNGTYNRVRSWASDAAAGIKIRSDYHDTHDSDIATALSTCITKDGRTQPQADIPMNGKKIINHGSTLTSDGPNTVATKNYVDNFKAFATGLNVTGSNYPNGMLHFSSGTGVTGISWVNADMSWVGKTAEAGKWRQRLCVTNDAQGAGIELVTIDKGGIVNNYSGHYTNNLSHDGTNWRTNVTGIGSVMQYANGTMTLSSNDVATVQNNQIATMQAFWTLSQYSMTHVSNSHAYWVMQKKKSGETCSIRGYTGSSQRWDMELGNTTAESGAYTGSDFVLTAYNNSGAGPKTMMVINRALDRTTFIKDIYTTGGVFASTTQYATLASGVANGQVTLRPNGPTSDTEQVYVNNVGDWHITGGHLMVDANTTRGSYLGMGQMGRNGTTGAYTGNWHNWLWYQSELYAMVDNTNIGMVSTPCDYRIKRNVKPLESTWDKVKKLLPVSYQRREFGDLFKEDDKIRWGFVAHELQKTLIEDAATFTKDEPNVIQGPNVMVVLAAVTKALQEAMGRIEDQDARIAALEGGAPA